MHQRRQCLVLGACAAGVTAGLIGARPVLLDAATTPGTRLAAFTAWAVAVGAALWLGASSAACWIALRRGRAGLARRLARLGPPVVRRLLEPVVAGALVLGAAVPTANAATAHDVPVVRAPASAVPIPAPEPGPALPPPEPPQAAQPTRHIVRPGENLWVIARNALPDAPEHDVARYWQAVIAANRATLRSGNPALIFPGEVVVLPGLPERVGTGRLAA